MDGYDNGVPDSPGSVRVRPSEPGRVTCLKCERQWDSPDRFARRVCPDCTRDQERVGLIGERASRVHGLDDRDRRDSGAAAALAAATAAGVGGGGWQKRGGPLPAKRRTRKKAAGINGRKKARVFPPPVSVAARQLPATPAGDTGELEYPF